MLDPKFDYRAIVSVGERPYLGYAAVAINSNCYYTKTIKFANELVGKLKQAIPFVYNDVSEPEIHVLGGQRVAGMLSVEFTITFETPNEEAKRLFKEAGFWDSFEFYK